MNAAPTHVEMMVHVLIRETAIYVSVQLGLQELEIVVQCSHL